MNPLLAKAYKIVRILLKAYYFEYVAFLTVYNYLHFSLQQAADSSLLSKSVFEFRRIR